MTNEWDKRAINTTIMVVLISIFWSPVCTC